IVAVAISGIVIGGVLLVGGNNKTKLTVFNAGSLTVPLQHVEAQFEKDHPNVDVQIEPAGSLQCIAKITQVGKIADVLATSDWKLIPSMPSQYQDYYIKFAVNRMVIAYTNTSKYADQINSTNFYNILNKTDIHWGLADPNSDPCGYRTLMVLKLADINYNFTNSNSILNDLVVKHSDITCKSYQKDNTTYYNITAPENVNPTGNLEVRDKSEDFVSMLQSGGIDYAFEYQSVAQQHHLEYIQLNDSIDLSNSNLDSLYQRVSVIKTSGVSTGKSITYGITVPKNANHPQLAAEFIEYVINAQGKAIFTTLGQPPLNPCITNNMTALPPILRSYCTSES
ncbi:MAG: tungstate ABC transporter substrate-binding protein WtpA, partial [Candidatus Lokiarchaeota archaeon]